MKKIAAGVAMICVLAGVSACEQKPQKQQQQLNYTGLPGPSVMQVEQLEKAAQSTPNNAQGWTRLGDALMDAQRFSEAINAYEKSVALEPKNPPVLVDLGTCYRGVGKFDKAIELYQRALKIDPKFPNAHRNMGVVLGYDLNRREEGIKSFKKYLEIVPSGPDADGVKQAIQELQRK